MRYFENIENGIVVSIEERETLSEGKEITVAEYDHILSVIRSKPTAPDGYGYRLTDGLEWELYELPVEETDEEVSESEALTELMEVLA